MDAKTREFINRKLLEDASTFPLPRFLNKNGSLNLRKIKQLHPHFQQEALDLIFIQRAVKSHGGLFFGYEESHWISTKQLIRIYCYDHEDYFLQRGDVHLQGYGCPHCKGKQIIRETEYGSFDVPCQYHLYKISDDKRSIIWYNNFSKLEKEIDNE